MRLAGKRALVTGAASGIGKAVVVTFQREGAEVIGADKDFPPAASGIVNGGTAVCLDVSQETDWERLFQEVVQLDILVACAGISEAKPIPESSLGDWRRVMGVNLDGAFLSVKYGVKAMRASRGGAIVLVGSASGIKAARARVRIARAKRPYGCWRRRRRWNSSLKGSESTVFPRRQSLVRCGRKCRYGKD